MTEPGRSYLFASDAELGGGWYAGLAVDTETGEAWPVVFDAHQGGAPILLGPALDHIAPHDTLA